MLEKCFEKISGGKNPTFEMKIPEKLSDGYDAGEFQVVGSMVKVIKTGKIVGHLQRTFLDMDFSKMQLINPYLGAANLAVSIANLGISLVILKEVKKTQSMIGSIQEKIDYLLQDKLRSNFTELREIFKSCPLLLEIKDPTVAATNMRDSLRKIRGELFFKLNEVVETPDNDIHCQLALVDAIKLCQELSIIAFYVTDDLKAAKKFGLQEYEEIKNFFLKHQGKEKIYGWTGVLGLLDDQSERYQFHDEIWQPFQIESVYNEGDVKLLNDKYRNLFQKLASQIGITNTLIKREINGLEYLRNVIEIKNEPARFLASAD